MPHLIVDNMTCNSCAQAITRAILALDPQAIIDIDLPNKTVQTTSTQDISIILNALKNAGFSATLDLKS